MGVMLFSGAQLSASIPGGPNYGNDLNVDERKTYLAERVVITKDFSGDRQLMLNELLKTNKSCQNKDDLYRLAVESIQLTPNDKAAWHALVKVAATDNDLSFLMLSIVIGKNAKWYADKYDYDDLIEVERNFSFWIDQVLDPSFKRQGGSLEINLKNCNSELQSEISFALRRVAGELATKTKSSLQLQLSPSVKNVTFAGNAVAAKKKMKLVADCGKRNLNDVSKN